MLNIFFSLHLQYLSLQFCTKAGREKRSQNKKLLRFTKCGGEFLLRLVSFFFTAVDFFNNEQITLERQKKALP